MLLCLKLLAVPGASACCCMRSPMPLLRTSRLEGRSILQHSHHWMSKCSGSARSVAMATRSGLCRLRTPAKKAPAQLYSTSLQTALDHLTQHEQQPELMREQLCSYTTAVAAASCRLHWCCGWDSLRCWVGTFLATIWPFTNPNCHELLLSRCVTDSGHRTLLSKPRPMSTPQAEFPDNIVYEGRFRHADNPVTAQQTDAPNCRRSNTPQLQGFPW